MRKSKFNILIISLFLSILLSCGIAQKNDKKEEFEEQNIQKDTSSFMKIISVIPDIKLPYSMWYGIDNNDNQYPDAEELGSDIAKLVPEVSVIVGKLPINNDNIYILYGLVGDILYPCLNIYDKNGKRVDSLYLHIGYCVADENIINSSATTIYKNFSIQMADTTQHIHYIENDKGYEKIIDSVIVKTRKMNLTKDGYYKMTEEKAYRIE